MTQIFRSLIQTGDSATTVALCAHFLTSSIQPPSQVTETPHFMEPECSLASSERPIAAHPQDTHRALDALRPCSQRFGEPHYFRFQLLPSCSLTTTATVNLAVFWGITPCSLAERCSCFGGTCCLHLQDTLHLTTRHNTLIRNAAGYFLPQLFDGYKKTRDWITYSCATTVLYCHETFFMDTLWRLCSNVGREKFRNFLEFLCLHAKVCNIPVYHTATFLVASTGNLNVVMRN